MGRFGPATSGDPKQNIGEVDPGRLGLVAGHCLAGLVLVWHQLEESVGRASPRGLGALGPRHGVDCTGLVPDDAGGAAVRVEVVAGEPRRCRFTFLWLGARIFWLATGGDQSGAAS